MMKNKTQLAFTLAELLIALAILGVIATFTIPKILDSGSDSKFNSIAKEAAGMISGAFQQYKLNNGVTGATAQGDLTPYFNYVKVDSVAAVDGTQTSGSVPCNGVYLCLELHNGAYIWYRPTGSFNDTAPTNAMWFHLDPDGKYSGTTTGPGKGVTFWLYTTGKLRTWGTIDPNTYDSFSVRNPTPAYDPPWFSWSN